MHVFCVWAPLAFSILFLLLRNNFSESLLRTGFVYNLGIHDKCILYHLLCLNKLFVVCTHSISFLLNYAVKFFCFFLRILTNINLIIDT